MDKWSKILLQIQVTINPQHTQAQIQLMDFIETWFYS